MGLVLYDLGIQVIRRELLAGGSRRLLFSQSSRLLESCQDTGKRLRAPNY